MRAPNHNTKAVAKATNTSTDRSNAADSRLPFTSENEFWSLVEEKASANFSSSDKACTVRMAWVAPAPGGARAPSGRRCLPRTLPNPRAEGVGPNQKKRNPPERDAPTLPVHPHHQPPQAGAPH